MCLYVQKNMQLNDFLKQAHLCIEARQGKRITQKEMAQGLGVSSRTYVEYLRGTNSPVGMRTLLGVMTMMDERDLVELLDRWKTSIKSRRKK